MGLGLGVEVRARARARVGVRGPVLTGDAARGVQFPEHDDEAQQVTEVPGDAEEVHKHGCAGGWHGVRFLSLPICSFTATQVDERARSVGGQGEVLRDPMPRTSLHNHVTHNILERDDVVFRR